MEEERTRKENIVAGVVGAFLGSLIGVVCTVVIGQLGYVAAISGLIMAVCALKGYELLGGTLSKKGVAVSAVLILAMTWFAHRLSWAVALAIALEQELTILESFRAIPYMLESGILESRPYWGDLVMLYLFTLLGAVPTIINGLKNTAMPEAPRTAGGPAQAPETEAVFCSARREWTRPLRFSASLSVVPGLVLGVIAIIAAAQMGAPISVSMAGLGCIVSSFVMIFCALPMMQANQAESYLYVRAAGTLWRVNLAMLNNMDTYRFANKLVTLTGMCWDSLSMEEQERARASVLRAVSLLNGGQVMPGSALSRAVLPLTDYQFERETDWGWRGTYALRNGRRKRITIPKCYPGFAPAPGLEPCQEPAPFQWRRIALGLVLAAALGAVGYIGGSALEGKLYGSPSGGKTASGNELTGQAPGSTLTYEINGVSCEIDSTFEMRSADTFQDPDTLTEYTLSVQTGMDEDAAVERLLQPISDYRMSSSFQGFSFAHADEEDTLVPLTAADGMVWQYEILTVRFTTGAAVHEAVALANDGVLVEVRVNQTKTDGEDEVKGTILYILESLRRTGSSQVEITGPAQVEITEENYQSLFHLGTEWGWSHTAVGYIRVPAEMFGYDAFVDAHVPYSDGPEYLEDGTVLRAAAHGMEVSVTITPSAGDARDVVEAAYEEMAASGLEIVAEGVTETFFLEEEDVAAKQAAYWEDGQSRARIAILYADCKQDGFYLSARITYFLEQLDDTYPELLAELCDAYAINLPEVEPMELS